MLVITIRDDGRGIDREKIRRTVVRRQLVDEQVAEKLSDAELLEFVFLPAFSTADGVTEVSGRGVGLDVVHSMVHGVGGSVRVQSEVGRGTLFQLELPITLSVIRAVLVKIAGESYAVPHNRIDRLVRLSRDALQSIQHRQYFPVDGRNVGVVLARQVLGVEGAAGSEDELSIVLFGHHADQYGLLVDEFSGESDLVVRPLDARLGKIPNISAAAILEDGSPVLILDLDDVRRAIERKLLGDALERVEEQSGNEEASRGQRILVVDDSITVREVQRQLLANQGYQVEVAVDGREGWNLLGRAAFDLVITDVDMPRLNGIELVRMIKSDPRLRVLPVVIVSYKDREQDRLRGLEAGADYYLTKSSFHDETLLRAVRDLIGEAH
jgi:two-component system sensor histidine kinase and response regulator WspE